MKKIKPLLLMILDGWGINPDPQGNAVFEARTPFIDSLLEDYAATRLFCSGEAVGLPEGYMGNSEVGHLNIGAGRVVYQELMRINRAISDGSFFKNEAFKRLMEEIRAHDGALHLMGLCSDSGVHSHLNHLYALLEMAKKEGLSRVYVHPIMDGRDSPPDSGITYVGQLQERIHDIGIGEIATLCGRYYAMDRDKRWDRTAKAFALYTQGVGVAEKYPTQAVANAYMRGETDEFIKPVCLVDETGKPLGILQKGDGVIVFNFRADRVRQITRAFADPTFEADWRSRMPGICGLVCMTLYDETFPAAGRFSADASKKYSG